MRLSQLQQHSSVSAARGLPSIEEEQELQVDPSIHVANTAAAATAADLHLKDEGRSGSAGTAETRSTRSPMASPDPIPDPSVLGEDEIGWGASPLKKAGVFNRAFDYLRGLYNILNFGASCSDLLHGCHLYKASQSCSPSGFFSEEVSRQTDPNRKP